MADCIFCKIVSGEIPCRKLYEDDNVLFFNDLNPQAPAHILAIPKKHIRSLEEVDSDNSCFVANIFEKIPVVMAELGFSEKTGYRLAVNCGEKAGQTVFHLHFHILAGRGFSWPPG